MAKASTSIPSGEINDNTIFSNMKQTCACIGIELKVLKTAKNLGAPGFNANGKIHWGLLRPWLEANKDNVETASVDSLDFWKKELTKENVIGRRLENKKLKEEMLDPDDVKQFLIQFSAVLSSVLKQKKFELISKANGYEKLIDVEFNSIFSLIKEELEKWTK
jgi:hypothetical protein